MKVLFNLALLLLGSGIPGAGQSFDYSQAILFHWPAPDERAIRLLREVGADVVIAPLEPGRKAKNLSIRVLAEIPRQDSLQALSTLVGNALEAGYHGATVVATGDRNAFEQFVRAQRGFVHLVYLKPDQLGWDVSPAHAVLQSGTWPGTQAIDPSSAGATERPWLNGNLHVYAYLRGLYPNRTPLLAFAGEGAPARFDTVEIALAEAFAAGGNAVLRMPEAYRLALLRGDSRAAGAWRSLGAVASFVKRHSGRRLRTDASTVAILSPGLEESEELLNMAFRNNVALRVLAGDSLPLKPGGALRLIVAPNLIVAPEIGRRLINFAKAGGVVMASPATEERPPSWWAVSAGRRIRSESNRDIYAVGAGKVYAYRTPIFEPAEFALDLRDAAGLNHRTGVGLQGLDFRIWNSSSVLGVLSRNGPGELMLALTHYGNDRDLEILVGVRGRFQSATVEHPFGSGLAPLILKRRNEAVEFELNGWNRLAMVVLKEAR